MLKMLVGITGNAGLTTACALAIKPSARMTTHDFRKLNMGDLSQIPDELQRHKQVIERMSRMGWPNRRQRVNCWLSLEQL
jgi:hypothetical protein